MKAVKTKLGLLGVAVYIKNYKFDSKKFLNGLTETEFKKISERIDSNIAYARSPDKFRAIIESLRLQENHKNINASFKGINEPAEFVVKAVFVRYNPVIQYLLNEFSEIGLTLNNNGVYMTDFLNLNLGEDKISIKSKDIVVKDKVLLEGLLEKNLDEPEIKSALFKSAMLYNAIPMMTPQAYEVIPISERLGKSKISTEYCFSISGEYNGRKIISNVDILKMRFQTKGVLLYRFSPCLGGFDDLCGKFGLRNYVIH